MLLLDLSNEFLFIIFKILSGKNVLESNSRRRKTFKTLLEEGIDSCTSIRDRNGDTLLHVVARGGDKELMKLLLGIYGKEIDFFAQNQSQDTAVSVAAREGHVD